ncbi:kelch repeat-containing protein [Pseudoalteromonas sp. MTN2-4]|uniref:kelch repeat-containing protein n=1 Tax=Pseudoalteromonas sp. MTN2-4 TaxID=3056555 RepID=UPI0036F1F3F5
MGGSNLSEVLHYNAKRDTRQPLARLPEPRAGHAATIINERIYVFGGEHHSGVYQNILRYDLQTDAFAQYIKVASGPSCFRRSNA